MTRVELDERLVQGLDRFIEDRDQPPKGRMSREEAVAVVVEDWLMSQGYIPLPGDRDGIKTALDAAKVPKA